jgi:hypothetical protein
MRDKMTLFLAGEQQTFIAAPKYQGLINSLKERPTKLLVDPYCFL